MTHPRFEIEIFVFIPTTKMVVSTVYYNFKGAKIWSKRFVLIK
jgi:hypothetical protein